MIEGVVIILNKKFILLLILIIGIFFFLGCTEEKRIGQDLSEIKMEKCVDNSACYYVDECLSYYSFYTKDNSVCEFVSDENKKNICQSNEEPEFYKNYINFFDNIKRANSLEGLEKIYTLANHSETYVNYLLNKKISEQEDKEYSFSTISNVSYAYESDPNFSASTCDKISDKESSDWCKLFFKEPVDNYFCNSLSEKVKGECYFILAIQNNDVSLCNKAKVPTLYSILGANSCEDLIFTKKAIDYSDVTQCKEIKYSDLSGYTYLTKYSLYASCVLQVVHKTKDLSKCNFLEKKDSSNPDLISYLSYIPENYLLEGCSKGDWFSDFEQTELNSKRTLSKEELLKNCENEKDKSLCTNLAIKYKDASFCNALEDVENYYLENVENCYYQVYLHTKDKSFVKYIDIALKHYVDTGEELCSNMLDETSIIACYSILGTYSKNSSYCDKALNNYKLDLISNTDELITMCYLENPNTSNDSSVCSKFNKNTNKLDWIHATNFCYTAFTLFNKEPKNCMMINYWDNIREKKSIESQYSEKITDRINESKNNKEVEIICSNNNYNAIKEKDYLNYTDDGYFVVLDEESESKLESEIKTRGSEALKDISELTCLTKLDLSYLSLDDIYYITSLKNLKELDLSGNKSIKNLDFLNSMQGLIFLDMIGLNELDNFEAISKLNNLKKIWVSEGFDLEILSDLNSLEDVSVFGSIPEDVKQLDYIKSIKDLYVDELSQEQANYLENLENLDSLTFTYRGKIKDYSFLRLLPNLKYFQIIVEKYDGFDFSIFKEVPIKWRLDIDCDKGVTELKNLDKLINLESIRVSFCREINNSNAIEKLVNLESIYFFLSKFNNVDLFKLPNLGKSKGKISIKVESMSDELKRMCENYSNQYPEKYITCEEY